MKEEQVPKVCFDLGEGFWEQNAQKVEIKKREAGRISFSIPIPKEAKALKMIPSEKSCLVMMSRLYIEGNLSRLVDYSSNGVKVANHSTAFVNADPHFMIETKTYAGQTLFVEMLIEIMHGDILVDLIEGDLVNLAFQLENARRDYHTLLQSMCWKITKPLRVAMDLAKRREKRERFRSEPILFEVILKVDKMDKEILNNTIESLQLQTYQKWRLRIIIQTGGKTTFYNNIVAKTKQDSRIMIETTDFGKDMEEEWNRIISSVKGQYLVFLSDGDYVTEQALKVLAETIEEKQADLIYSDEDWYDSLPIKPFWPNYKPDFSPETLRSINYIGNFFVSSLALLKQAGGITEAEEQIHFYDILLRLSEKANRIYHVPKVLVYRNRQNLIKNEIKSMLKNADLEALKEHLGRMRIEAKVSGLEENNIHRICYSITGDPLVSILIPNKDHVEDLKKCLDSIQDKTNYQNYEILIIENNSEKEETFAYYETLIKNTKCKVIKWEKSFNYSAINNFGVSHAKGDYILLLNNDVEVITNHWLEEMLGTAMQKGIGAVGAMLLYPDNTVQHAGAVYGICGLVGHVHKNFPKDAQGYYHRLQIAQNFSCVTAACLMVPRKVFQECKGLDERFEVAFNDMDFCLRIRKHGYRIVMTPFAKLYHYESKSRGAEDSIEKLARFHREIALFRDIWQQELLLGDPYYNENLTAHRDDFYFKKENICKEIS